MLWWTFLGLGPNLPAKKRRKQDVTSYPNRVHLSRTGPQPNCQVVRNVPARRVTHHEHAVKVNAPTQPRVLLQAQPLPLEPPHRLHGVVYCGRKTVLRRQTVVRRNHHRLEPRREAHATVVNMGPRARTEAKASTVKEHHNRKLLVIVYGCYVLGLVEAKRKVESFVKEIILIGYGVVLNG